MPYNILKVKCYPNWCKYIGKGDNYRNGNLHMFLIYICSASLVMQGMVNIVV